MDAIFDIIGGTASAEVMATAFAASAGGAALMAVVAIYRAFLDPNPTVGRAKSLMERRRALSAGLVRPAGHTRRHGVTGQTLAKRIVDRLNLMKSRHAEETADKLAAAGWRSKDTLTAFLAAKVVLPPALGIGTAAVVFGLPMGEMPVAVKAMLAMAAALAGAYGPDIIVKNAAIKRQDALNKGLPDALDLMVICAEAGLSLDAAFARVARETERACPEIADEYHLTAIELGLLPDRRRALENLAKRTRLPALRAVVSTLMQTEIYGTPLAQSLRVLSAEQRDTRMMKAEEKAARLPATLTIPLILFILPALFVVLLGPAALSTIDNLLTMY